MIFQYQDNPLLPLQYGIQNFHPLIMFHIAEMIVLKEAQIPEAEKRMMEKVCLYLLEYLIDIRSDFNHLFKYYSQYFDFEKNE